MGDNLPATNLAAIGANLTIHLLAANSNPCVVLSSTAAIGMALKCWGPNGYGQLGLVRRSRILITVVANSV